MKLSKVTDAPRFSFEGCEKKVKLLDVYDGDTVTIAFKYKRKIWKMSCRMDGIDTPEVRSSNPLEKRAAYLAKDQLLQLCSGPKLLDCQFGKFDKYGRPLITLWNKQMSWKRSINSEMIISGFALIYNGKSKQDFYFDTYPLK